MTFVRPAIMLGHIAVASLTLSGPSWAAVEQSRFETNGNSVRYELREVSRKDVLERLFASQGIAVEWKDKSVADELVTGRYDGTVSSVARQLLTGTDFVLRYDMSQGKSRIVRVLVLGRAATTAPASSRLAALDNTPETARPTPPSAADSSASPKEPPRRGNSPASASASASRTPETQPAAAPMPPDFGNFTAAAAPVLEPSNGQASSPVPQPVTSAAGMPIYRPGGSGPVPSPATGGAPVPSGS